MNNKIRILGQSRRAVKENRSTVNQNRKTVEEPNELTVGGSKGQSENIGPKSSDLTPDLNLTTAKTIREEDEVLA